MAKTEMMGEAKKKKKQQQQQRMKEFAQTLADHIRTEFSSENLSTLLRDSDSDCLKKLVKSWASELPESSFKRTLLKKDRLQSLLDHLRQNLQNSVSSEEEQKFYSSGSIQDSVHELLKCIKSSETLDEEESKLVFDDLRKRLGRHFLGISEPTLELIWSFSTASILSQNPDNVENCDSPLDVAKELFKVISLCTAGNLCSGNTSIAALVPVIALIFKCLINCFGKGHGKILKRLRSTVEEVLGFISVCRSKRIRGSGTVKNLRKWVACCDVFLHKDIGGSMEKFTKTYFPLISEETQAELIDDDGCTVEQLANVVILKSILLRLMIEIIDMERRADCGNALNDEQIRRNLRILAVNCIRTAGNAVFYDTLLSLLLEPRIPFATYLNRKQELVLTGVLYEATALVDYDYLIQNKRDLHNASCFEANDTNKTLLRRFIVAQRAIQFFKSQGERSWAVSFAKSFTKISIPSELMHWLNGEVGSSKTSRKNSHDLIGWLVNTDDDSRLKQILDKHSALRADEELKKDSFHENFGVVSHHQEEDLFIVDKQGASNDYEDSFAAEMSFIAAAHKMGGVKKSSDNQDVGYHRHAQLEYLMDINPSSNSDLSENEHSDSDAIDKRKRAYSMVDSDTSDLEDRYTGSNDLGNKPKKKKC